ncbi:hypothetical protein D9758_010403 [Tetrapyrgos nigripes]|uniref:F-box domain-containing protein n=1 Tax=Tetrapyrgos nigripes TaxID=182062 RepID=A0A8H5FVX9_9AGAR|nr:hypothetical protein D9758_010403 [Tetrapyrgos nigripes]
MDTPAITLTDLPVELITIVLEYSEEDDVVSLAAVCRVLNAIAGSHFLKSVHFRHDSKGLFLGSSAIPFRASRGLCTVLDCLSNVSYLMYDLTDDYVDDMYKGLSVLKNVPASRFFHLSYFTPLPPPHTLVGSTDLPFPLRLLPSPSSATAVLLALFAELVVKSTRSLHIDADLEVDDTLMPISLPPLTSLEDVHITAPFLHTRPFRTWITSSLNASRILRLYIGSVPTISPFLSQLSLPSLQRFTFTDRGEVSAIDFASVRSFLLRHPSIRDLNLTFSIHDNSGDAGSLPLPNLKKLFVHPSLLPHFLSLPGPSPAATSSSLLFPNLQSIHFEVGLFEHLTTPYTYSVWETVLRRVSAQGNVTELELPFEDFLNFKHPIYDPFSSPSQILELPSIQLVTFLFSHHVTPDELQELFFPWFNHTFPNARRLAIHQIQWAQQEESSFAGAIKEKCPQVETLELSYTKKLVEEWLAQDSEGFGLAAHRSEGKFPILALYHARFITN